VCPDCFDDCPHALGPSESSFLLPLLRRCERRRMAGHICCKPKRTAVPIPQRRQHAVPSVQGFGRTGRGVHNSSVSKWYEKSLLTRANVGGRGPTFVWGRPSLTRYPDAVVARLGSKNFQVCFGCCAGDSVIDLAKGEYALVSDNSIPPTFNASSVPAVSIPSSTASAIGDMNE
jgi:hypothetical protein